MKHLNTIRIRVFIGVFVFAAALFTLVQYQYEIKLKQILTDSERSKNQTIVSTALPVLAVNAAFELQDENRRYIRKLAKQNPEIVSVVLTDNHGRRILQWRREGSEAAQIDAVRGIMKDPSDNHAIGEAVFRFVNTSLLRTEKEYSIFVWRFLFVTLLLFGFLVILLRRAFSPLDQLVAWIKGFDPKHDAAAGMPKISSSEVAMIAVSMQNMFERIRHYTSELDTLNRQLDRKVQERTKALEQANEKLTELSRMDALTGVANRRYFQEHLHAAWALCIRERIPISLVICDIDYFKKTNDTYGHLAGDAVLAKIAHTLKSTVRRRTDMVARYGGEEFVFILLDTPMEDALEFVRTIQKEIAAIGAYPPPAEDVSGITLSIGLCTHVPQPGESVEKCISAADTALYKAKNSGRNRVVSVPYD